MKGPNFLRLFWCTAAFIVLALSFSSIATAQVSTGTITGRVTDPSGASVPGVNVTITEQNTGVSVKTKTAANGNYSVSPLKPGVYSVTVEASGFQRAERTNLALQVQAILQADFQLQIGRVSQQVNKEGSAKTPGSPKSLLDLLEIRGQAQLFEAVPVTMRDGVQLSASIIVPNGGSAGSKRPVILMQSPYYAPQAEASGGIIKLVLMSLVHKGYVIVIVNDRGTGWSEGEYHWMKRAQKDGLDVLKWVTQQPWSNGKVGTIGCSSSGEVEIPLAMANPPALKAVVAMAAASGVGVIPGFADQGIFYTGGVPSFMWASWFHGYGYQHHPKLPRGISQAERAALSRAFDSETRYRVDDLSWAEHLPSGKVLDAIGSPETEFNTLITLKPNSPEWKNYDFLNTGQKTTVPILHVDSWYDTIEVYGTTKMFEYLSGNSPNQYMTIGPTSHCRMGNETEDTMIGQRPVGDARFDYTGMIVKWFDHWLEDDGRGDLKMPKVQYYSIESNKWTSAAGWPPPSTPRKLFLSSGGHANSLSGDGKLVDAPPGTDAPPDNLVDDPMHPVPMLGGGCCSAQVSLDQTGIEKRSDVLVYTTAPFEKGIDIAGYIKATLYLSSSVPDGDIMVKLVDVYPDGKAYNITDTAQRLRYRDGIYKEALMSPGKTYKVTLGQMVAASHFAPGHRIRIEIAGTNFPEYERNMHTGGSNFDEVKPVAARVKIYHDRDHASFLELPLIQ
jgi:hypothetical protein